MLLFYELLLCHVVKEPEKPGIIMLHIEEGAGL
jgi:hypothetical protein